MAVMAMVRISRTTSASKGRLMIRRSVQRGGQRQRNMLATLMFAQGTPMLLAGDEMGRSQSGNNNGYNQDNETTWIDWAGADHDLLALTRRLIELRQSQPVLRQRRFLHGDTRADGAPDLIWRRADGKAMTASDWNDADRRLVIAELRMSADTASEAGEGALLLILNAGEATTVTLAAGNWQRLLDTSEPLASPEPIPDAKLNVNARQSGPAGHSNGDVLMENITVATQPIEGQKPGTSGLRKKNARLHGTALPGELRPGDLERDWRRGGARR